jgi:cysteine-rich repeat protein
MRRGLAALFLSAWAAPAVAAPGGTCADAVSVDALPFMASANTCGASNDFANDTGGAAICADLPKGYGGEDVYYKIVLGPGNKLAFDLTMPGGATGDLALFLVRQSGCADPATCAGNSVDLIGAGLGPERIKLQSYPPGTYYLIVDSALSSGTPGQCGAYDLAITGHLSEFCGNGIVEAGEVCDDGNNIDSDCCSADCKSQKPAGATCRDVAAPCDVGEVCDGSGHCPADAFRDTTTMCRAATDVCDVPDFCSGTGPACPADRVAPFGGRPCRNAVGPCDRAEVCDGINKACPVDKLLPTGAICASGNNCTLPARCAGTAACPPPTPISCNDNNDCTRDMCDLVASCVHINICGDAGADASPDVQPDGPPDLAPDRAPDMSFGTDTLATDARMPDALPPSKTDAAPVDAPPMLLPPDAAVDAAALANDATPEEETNKFFTLEGGVGIDGTGPSDAGAEPDGLHNASPDGAGTTGDLGGRTDLPGINPITSPANGCSCRLNSSSSREESVLWTVPVLALVVRIARRRRRHA